jgi:hypothetical protein
MTITVYKYYRALEACRKLNAMLNRPQLILAKPPAGRTAQPAKSCMPGFGSSFHRPESAVIEKIQARLFNLNRLIAESQKSSELAGIAERALEEIQAVLEQMRCLTARAAESGLSAAERSELQKKVDALIAEIDCIAAAAEKKAVLVGCSPGPAFH